MKYFACLLAVIGLALSTGCKTTECTKDKKCMTEAAPEPTDTLAEAIVVDDADQGFGTEGGWSLGWTSKDYKSGLKWAYLSTKATATATWSAEIPVCGQYEVFEWHGADPHSDHATDAPFTVHYADGSKTVLVNQRENAGQWNSLGTYTFKKGTTAKVTVTNKANGNVIADAVKFEYKGN